MPRLSTPLERLRPRYDVVVVGSGYGGAIAASRLARAGRTVCVLERGPERQPGEYPETTLEANGEVQAHTPTADIGSPTALFHFKVDDEMVVLTGCGLGGTSLINANVALRADPRVFDDPVWPAALRADHKGLDEGYARAKAMLRPNPYPDTLPPLAKYRALQRSGERLGLPVRKLDINVTFTDGVNHVGVEQKACILCGDCVTGCNHHAKNTTLMNYLPDAVNHGAEIFTSVPVRRLERTKDGWLVHFDALGLGREKFAAPQLFVAAEVVVLGAGALGSTEILLRSRAAGVPMSQRVGERFSGNGDILGFAYNADQEINGIGLGTRVPRVGHEVGPCITGVIDGRGTKNLEEGFVIEEGSVPGPVGALNPAMYASAGPFIGERTEDKHQAAQALRTLESLFAGPYKGATARAQTFLVMSHDDSGGKLSLEKDRLRLKWPGVGKQEHFKKMDDNLREASAGVGAVYYRNPLWTSLLGDRLITVHALGGCPMAERAEDGVVNHQGQVFKGEKGDAVWKDLLVVDGSVLPRSVGVNPLFTISATAERSLALLAADRGWTIDYALPSRPSKPAAATVPSLEFTEKMSGFWSKGAEADFQHAAKAGKAANSPFAFTLTIRAEDARALIDVPPHAGRIFGTVDAPALSPHALTVSHGEFNLFADDANSAEEKRMRYRMAMHATDGHTFFFDGFKRVRKGGILHAWPDTSTLYITIHDGADEKAPVLGRGVLHIQPADFQRQMTTMKVEGAKNAAERLAITYGFGRLFAGVLFETYGSVFGQTTGIHEKAEPRKRRALAMGAPELHTIVADDGTPLLLTRFKGGTKGPLLVAPGFGNSVGAYMLDTIDENFTEFFYAAGYDVWLFDYRASPALPSASQPFTIDDIARRDWPAAVAAVRTATGAADVQVVAHCVGSLSFLMAQLAGLTGVRSAVCSALTAHPRAPVLTEAKARLKLPSVLNALGVKRLSTNADDPKWYDKALDEVMRLYPTSERCHSPVCRRILFMYGEVYVHDQLNHATHEAIHEMFGVAHMKPFAHLALMTEKGHLVDAEGKDAYMPHVDRLAIPITFIHGERNNMFLPEGSRLTYEWLRKANGEALYSRVVIKEYAHLDSFIGKDSARDVFPMIQKELEGPVHSGGAAGARRKGS